MHTFLRWVLYLLARLVKKKGDFVTYMNKKAERFKLPSGTIVSVWKATPDEETRIKRLLLPPEILRPLDAPITDRKYDNISIGTKFNKEKRTYELVIVGFDTASKEARVQEVIDVGSNKIEMGDRFRIEVVKRGLLDIS